MDRKEFIEKVAARTGADYKDVESVFQKFIELTVTALRDGEKVSITGFGTFSTRTTKAKKKFSPILNREVEIPEKLVVSFSPSSKLAEEINIKYKDEKPKIVQEASERKIERKVTILPEEQEEFLQYQKSIEEISKIEEEKKEEESEVGSEDVSLSVELLEALQESETEIEEKPQEVQFTSVVEETKEEKDRSFQMPELKPNQDKPKLIFDDDLTIPSSTGGYKQSVPSSATINESTFKDGESSTALRVTLIILLIGIIGAGIYLILNSDIINKMRETLVKEEKGPTSPAVVEKQPITTDNKEITSTPGKNSNISADTSLKLNPPVIVQNGRDYGKDATQTLNEKRKPITRRVSKPPINFQKQLNTFEGNYFIQVNSFTQKRFADEFAKNLRNKGYRAFVESGMSSDYGTVYRVKVGFYINEDAAYNDYHSLRLLLKKDDIYVDRR